MPVLNNPTIGAESFRRSVAEAIREQADLAASGDSLVAKARGRTLRLLADHVESLDPEDQHLAALAEAQREGANTSDSDNRWQPRLRVMQVLAHAGSDLSDPPKSADLLDEVVRYAASDSRKALREQLVADVTLRAQQEREAASAKLDAEVSRVQERGERLEERLSLSETELAETRKERDHLRALVEGEKSKPLTQAV